ncbi:hypothetical protein FisN_2Lh304 [Fistulifera solaris]|uniref:CMP/dCMP-type deaminase domain-containing protein n=1 Tax=Fistulifera solaris TaxID=1519565 RepID=A0A1Z5KFC4_FISSO|nr:hypothetical protein FisN_2Lh304 [Fistulifera solaris]|eukprot:GAX25020.1 hypothetical protein FisN_2Lh304 [Fistulifera solaris]
MQPIMAKKSVEDVNGLSGKEALGDIVGKKNTDKIVEEKDETAASKSMQETSESIPAEDTSTKKEEGPASKLEERLENLEEPQTAVDPAQSARDEEFMHLAIDAAITGDSSPFPQPDIGAVLVSAEGKIMGHGRSDYNTHAVRACFENAGLSITPLSEWCVSWPEDETFRRELSQSTLYVTLEPSNERQGTALPPMTRLIQLTGVRRVVIGCADPVQSRALKGASALHAAGIDVFVGTACESLCKAVIEDHAILANSKLHRMARNNFRQFKRPLGFLHCSVVASDNVQAFARHGNAFGTEIDGKKLSYRDLGRFEIAPPPEVIWADTTPEGDDGDFFNVDFEEESLESDPVTMGSPMMPWYEQVDAVVATFPKAGNGPTDDTSVTARLNGLKWLATHGEELPAGVERIIVMDATDLPELPLSNKDPNLPRSVDVESFWRATGRKKTRVLLRRGLNERARAAALAAANAAAKCAELAQAAAMAIESGDAERCAQAAIEYEKLAKSEMSFIQDELGKTQKLKAQLEEYGVVVETIEGGEPVDVMKHLGERNGYQTVVWRAGCWGDRGVQSILAGAFQWVSAHLAVDAIGGRFWQLMLAENALQSACGPARKVKVFADQEDISLEYCDEPEADMDCRMNIDGRPIRHVRLDARLVLVDDERPREFMKPTMRALDRRYVEEQAPWFL